MKSAVVALSFILVALAGCGAQKVNSVSIAGTWEGLNQQRDVTVIIHFNDDHTGWMVGMGRGTALGDSFTFTVDDNRLTIAGNDPTAGPPIRYRCKLSATMFSLSDDREQLTLHRANSDFARDVEQEMNQEITARR